MYMGFLSAANFLAMSNIVKIGNAVCDENGTAGSKNSKPGNQTGKELRVQPWYLSKSGWVVLRPKDKLTADKIAYDCNAACLNKFIGYNQKRRGTLYTYAKQYDFDCYKVHDACECDCSSLVRVCCAYAGIVVGSFNTASEVKTLMATGKFEKLTDPKYTEQSDYLMRGDILVTVTKGHTAVVLNDGPKSERPGTEPSYDPLRTAILVKGSVKVRTGNGTEYPVIGTARNCKLVYLGQAEEEPYWYKTVFKGQGGYITSKEKYTELVEA